MKALVFHKLKDVRVEEVADPQIKDPGDVILKVTSTAICGSDLHIYNSMFPQLKDMILGHEFMGVIEETGANVKNFKKGDRVIVPFPIACGHCYFCNIQEPNHCENSNPEFYGAEGGMLKEKGGGIFGYTDLYGGYDGGQAEYVRVPYADFGLRLAPENLTDDQLLFLTDIFPTGWSAVDKGEVKAGDVVAVFGCGPVGLMAIKSAWLKGAKRVIALDVQDYRLIMADKVCKAEPINVTKTDAVEAIREMTGGRGADVCVDAVGMEADRSVLDRVLTVARMEKGTINALRLAFDSVKRGGIVSIVGVYGSFYDKFPLHQIFDKAITIKSGQAPVHRYIDQLLDFVKDDKIVLDDIITHKMPLADAAFGYDIFNNKEDNCVKIVLQP
ncbi:zinc-dependent alcohol dehydrogenase [soil metagenome]